MLTGAVRFDVDRDQAVPVCLALAAEQATGIRKGVGGAGGRLVVVVVVVGTSKVAANLRLTRGGTARSSRNAPPG